jgi:hypothetical protein
MKNLNLILLFLLFSTIFLTGCADVTPVHHCVTSDPYGFWGGL